MVHSCLVFHPKIRQSSEVEILRGLPEGSRLSPTLFGIVVADLIHKLQRRFPNATITHNGNSVWIGGILYVDDLCLRTTGNDPRGMTGREAEMSPILK